MKKIAFVQSTARPFALVLVLASLSWAGCFRSLNVNKLVCSKDESCPHNYFCSKEAGTTGICVPGPRSDASVSYGSRAEVGDGSSGDGREVLDGSRETAGDGKGETGTGIGGMDGMVTSTGGEGGTTTEGTGGEGGVTTSTTDTGGIGGSDIDAPIAGAGGTGGSGSGGTSSSGDAAVPDTSKGTGSACEKDQDCALGFCVDRVCCNERCAGQCQACAETGSVGTCKTVQSGQPRGSRTACIGTAPCQGSCDGSSATTCKMPTDRICKDESCSAGQHTPPSYCSSSGTCALQNAAPCSTGVCTGGGVTCSGSCTTNPDSCPTGQYCNSTTGACAAKKGNGTGNTCSLPAECTSGKCSPDGVCCQTDCPGQCQTCNNTTGTCTKVTSGQPVGNRTACTNSTDTVCGGRCDGTSDGCSYPTNSKSCGDPATCSTPDYSTRIAYACNSAGSCAQANTSCTSVGTCVGGSCTSKIATTSSTACQGDAQCQSGHCCNNRCRDISSDPANCGLCSRNCGSGFVCNGGACACPGGQLECTVGLCEDVMSSFDHCGTCAATCKTQGFACTSGRCLCSGLNIAGCGCQAWNFNDGSGSQGWSGPGYGVRGGSPCASTPVVYGVENPANSTFIYPAAPTLDGTPSFFVDFKDSGSCQAGAGVNLCSDGLVLANRTVSARMMFVSTNGLSSYYSNVSFSANPGPTSQIMSPNPMYADRQWYTLYTTVSADNTSACNQLGFLFSPGTWQGRVYIDNVTVN